MPPGQPGPPAGRSRVERLSRTITDSSAQRAREHGIAQFLEIASGSTAGRPSDAKELRGDPRNRSRTRKSNPARDHTNESNDELWATGERRGISMRALGIRLSYEGRMVNA
jgi:hypothetical protein